MAIAVTHGLDEAEAIKVGHVDIGDDHVRIDAPQDFEAVEAVDGLNDVKACFDQGQAQHVAHGPRVIDG